MHALRLMYTQMCMVAPDTNPYPLQLLFYTSKSFTIPLMLIKNYC